MIHATVKCICDLVKIWFTFKMKHEFYKSVKDVFHLCQDTSQSKLQRLLELFSKSHLSFFTLIKSNSFFFIWCLCASMDYNVGPSPQLPIWSTLKHLPSWGCHLLFLVKCLNNYSEIHVSLRMNSNNFGDLFFIYCHHQVKIFICPKLWWNTHISLSCICCLKVISK